MANIRAVLLWDGEQHYYYTQVFSGNEWGTVIEHRNFQLDANNKATPYLPHRGVPYGMGIEDVPRRISGAVMCEIEDPF